MADKKISELTLRTNVDDSVQFPIDDTVQTYRVTSPQVATYVLAKPHSISSKTATYTLLASDEIILASVAGGAFTLNLPTAVGISGKTYKIKRTDTTYANALTIDANGTETINGQLTLKLMVKQGCMIVSDGANWVILDQTPIPAGLIGSINWPSTAGSFYWIRQNTSFGAMGNNAGTASTPTLKNHATSPGNSTLALAFPALPAGNYRLVMYGSMFFSGGNGTNHGFRFNDGSTVSNAVISIAPISDQSFVSVEGLFSYSTDQGATTFTVEGVCDGTDSLIVDLRSHGLQIDVYYMPNI